jgi:hypothetical protein
MIWPLATTAPSDQHIKSTGSPRFQGAWLTNEPGHHVIGNNLKSWRTMHQARRWPIGTRGPSSIAPSMPWNQVHRGVIDNEDPSLIGPSSTSVLGNSRYHRCRGSKSPRPLAHLGIKSSNRPRYQVVEVIMLFKPSSAACSQETMGQCAPCLPWEPGSSMTKSTAVNRRLGTMRPRLIRYQFRPWTNWSMESRW